MKPQNMNNEEHSDEHNLMNPALYSIFILKPFFSLVKVSKLIFSMIKKYLGRISTDERRITPFLFVLIYIDKI